MKNSPLEKELILDITNFYIIQYLSSQMTTYIK